MICVVNETLLMQRQEGAVGTESGQTTSLETKGWNKAMRPTHVALHLAALTGRATEQPDTSAPIGVFQYCLLSSVHLRSWLQYNDAHPYFRAVHFALNMLKSTDGK